MDNLDKIIEIFEDFLDELDSVDLDEITDGISNMDIDEINELRSCIIDWSEHFDEISLKFPEAYRKITELKIELSKLDRTLEKLKNKFEE